jgi:O-antigen/teichoic acid export membrane protein
MIKLTNQIKSFLYDDSIKSIIFKNSFWLIFDQAIRILFSLIIGSWMIRYLGKDDYGQLSFVFSYLTLFQIITGLGAESTVIRDLIIKKDIANKTLGTIFYLRLLLGLFNWLISVLIIMILYGVSDSTYILTLIAGISLVFQSFYTIELWFRSNNKTFNFVVPKLFANILINVFKVYCIVNQYSIYFFAILFSIDILISGLFLFFSYSNFSVGKKWTFDMQVAKSILKDSWPFLVSAVSIFLYTRIDLFILKIYLKNSELGIYSAAIGISTILPILPMIMFNVLNPILARKKMESEEIYMKFLKYCFTFFVYLGILLSFFIYLFSYWIIQLLYGSEFSDAINVLKIHVFTNVFINIGIAHNLLIVNENKGKINVYKTLFGVILSIVLNFLLIPRYGVIGAAYSALIVQFVASFLINSILDPQAFRLQCRSLIIR